MKQKAPNTPPTSHSAKKTLALLVILTIAFSSFTPPKPRMIGKKMPETTGTTLNLVKIDSNYFKGKVTLVTFFYIGCPPCMNEIATLKKLRKDKDFQVLYIAPHTYKQLRLFNGDLPNDYAEIRNYYKADKIEYEMLPECEEEAWRDPNAKNLEVKPECNRLSGPWKVFGYPATFLVDRKQIIRQAWYGFSVDKNDSTHLTSLQQEIDNVLAFQQNGWTNFNK